MNVRASLLATTLAFAATAAYASPADQSFDRTLNVGNSPSVSVSTGSGYIHLNPGSDSQIHIAAHIHASSGGWMDGGSENIESRMKEIAANPPIHQNGNEVVIGERHSDLYRNISIDYDITLPRASSITAGSGSGSVEIHDVGTSLKAETGSGSIHANGIRGGADLQTGSGSIEFTATAPGDVRAQTGSGSLHLDGVNGALKAGTGSGNIDVGGKPTSDWKLHTGSGSIRLQLASAHFNVEASTGSGTIHVDQQLASSSTNRNHVSGAVNGGGPLVSASTGSGGIYIR
jgi:Putative adhesin